MVKVLRRQTAKQFPRSHALLEDIDPEAETLTRFMGMITSENEVIYAEVERLQAAVVQQVRSCNYVHYCPSSLP